MTETTVSKPKPRWYKQTLLWKVLRSGKRFYFHSIINVQQIIFIFLIQFFPRYAYFLSRMNRLIPPHQRLNKTDNFMDDFTVSNDPLSESLVSEEKINIVMRGISFDPKKLNDLKGTTYLINFSEKVEKKDVIYATGDKNVFKRFIEKEMTPILLLDVMDESGAAPPDIRGIEKYIVKRRVKRILIRYSSSVAISGMGSGLGLILALTKYAQHMTLYGFDHYQTKDLSEMSYWEALFSLGNFFYDGILSDIHPGTAPDVIERAIYTYHYANRFNEVSWISNQGFLKNVSEHKVLLKKLEKIIYK
jgi:hypothetical protein